MANEAAEFLGHIDEMILGLIGGGVLAAVANRMFTRKIDSASADRIRAEARQIAIETSSEEVNIMRAINQQLREDSDRRAQEHLGEKQAAAVELALLQAAQKELKDRVGKLEERERHMLTRAAVHEAWDQMAFKILSEIDPFHPEPPPLLDPQRIIEQRKDSDENG